METTALKNLDHLLKKLKVNKSKIPEAEQRGKYKKAFERLKESINMEHQNAFWDIVLSGMPLGNESEVEECKKKLVGLYDEAVNNGLKKQIADALFEQCDINLYLLIAMRFQILIEDQIYKDIWLSHTQLQNGVYHNNLIDMWYEDGVWQREGGCSCLGYPPTLEAYDTDIQERRDSIDAEIKMLSPHPHQECAVS